MLDRIRAWQYLSRKSINTYLVMPTQFGRIISNGGTGYIRALLQCILSTYNPAYILACIHAYITSYLVIYMQGRIGSKYILL